MTGRSDHREWGVVAALRDIYHERKHGEGLQALNLVLARDPGAHVLATSSRDGDLARWIVDMVQRSRVSEPDARAGKRPPAPQLPRPEDAPVVLRVAALLASTALAVAAAEVPGGVYLWNLAGFLGGLGQGAIPPGPEGDDK